MNEAEVIKLFKCLADASRLQILKSLMQEDMYVELLSQRLDLAPATVSFHLKKLMDAGAVTCRKEQYYTIYSLCREVFAPSMLELLGQKSDEALLQEQREKAYRAKVIDTFFQYGRLVSIPAQRKKKRICLEEIVGQFELGKRYDEEEVNEVILRYHEDYCTLRRDMISEKLMAREGRIYTRIN